MNTGTEREGRQRTMEKAMAHLVQLEDEFAELAFDLDRHGRQEAADVATAAAMRIKEVRRAMEQKGEEHVVDKALRDPIYSH